MAHPFSREAGEDSGPKARRMRDDQPRVSSKDEFCQPTRVPKFNNGFVDVWRRVLPGPPALQIKRLALGFETFQTSFQTVWLA